MTTDELNAADAGSTVGGHDSQGSQPSSEVAANSPISFSSALDFIKSGIRMARHGWNGGKMFLELQTPDAMSKMTLPYLYLTQMADVVTDNTSTPTVVFRVPWLASQTDLLATDWYTSEYQGIDLGR